MSCVVGGVLGGKLRVGERGARQRPGGGQRGRGALAIARSRARSASTATACAAGNREAAGRRVASTGIAPRSVRGGLLPGNWVTHDCARGNNRPQVQFEQNDFAGAVPTPTPLPMFSPPRDQPVGNLLFVQILHGNRRVGNRDLHLRTEEYSVARTCLPGPGAMLNCRLVRREPTFAFTRERKAAEGAGAATPRTLRQKD